MSNTAEKLETLYAAARSVYGDDTDFIYTGSEIQRIRRETGTKIPNVAYSNAVSHDTKRHLGPPKRKARMFNIAAVATGNLNTMKKATMVKPAAQKKKTEDSISVIKSAADNLVPEVNKLYVRFGNFNNVVKIINSGRFFPTLITGLSGNGKTMMIQQACARTRREFIRVNITSETDQDDLIGGFRLKKGKTVWHDGPVIEAMRRGSVLLLDEFDLGTDRIMCLQSILEGNSYYIKKTGRLIDPAPGFQIFLTANTKGQGDNTGHFIGARVMNEALLDRIKLTFDQGYPNPGEERKILNLLAKSYTDEYTPGDKEFIERVVGWVQAIRNSYFNDEVDSFISTRRAASVIETYFVFDRSREIAIKTSISRFNPDTVEAFETFYSAIDDQYNKESEMKDAAAENRQPDDHIIDLI